MPRPIEKAGMTVEAIREQVRSRYAHNPRVHLSVQMPHTKVVHGAEGVITGVYPHVFCVEVMVGGAVQRHAFQYTDLLTRRVEIVGME